MRRSLKEMGSFQFIDAFLLAIYNAEAAEHQMFRAASSSNNMPNNPLVKPIFVKVPPLATSSSYHDNGRLESEDKLDQRPSGLSFSFENWTFVDNLTASNRHKVFRFLLQTFNRHIVDLSKTSLDHFTRATIRLLEYGYGQQGPQHQRIQLDSSVMLELLFGAYVCMYNGFQVNTIKVSKFSFDLYRRFRWRQTK